MLLYIYYWSIYIDLDCLIAIELSSLVFSKAENLVSFERRGTFLLEYFWLSHL